MVFHQVLNEVLGQRSRVSLLRFLVRVRGEHTGRELARFVGLDHKTCHVALRALAEQGVVTVRRIGTGIAYALNERHPVVRDIVAPAFVAEAALLARYAEEVVRLVGEPVESVVLFGSVAREQERATSDVDLLLVAADRRAKDRIERRIDEATAELAARWGSVPQVLVIDRRSVRAKLRSGDPFYGEVVRSGRVLGGKSVAEALNPRRAARPRA